MIWKKKDWIFNNFLAWLCLFFFHFFLRCCFRGFGFVGIWLQVQDFNGVVNVFLDVSLWMPKTVSSIPMFIGSNFISSTMLGDYTNLMFLLFLDIWLLTDYLCCLMNNEGVYVGLTVSINMYMHVHLCVQFSLCVSYYVCYELEAWCICLHILHLEIFCKRAF